MVSQVFDEVKPCQPHRSTIRGRPHQLLGRPGVGALGKKPSLPTVPKEGRAGDAMGHQHGNLDQKHR